MTRLAAAFLITCLFAGPSLAQATSTSTVPVRPPASELDAFIERGMADWRLPGLSIVVVHDGASVYEKGFGVLRLGAPARVNPQTLFGMMSTTKAMTALAVAMLVDEGKVKWDDPVSKHLPWFQLPDAYLTAHVTVRDALRHSSGLANTDFLWAREDLTTREILERMRFAPTNGSLRSSWEYQNVMYQAAGEVVAAASGMSWDRFIGTRILEPLGMSRSYATFEAVASLKDPNTSVPHFEIDGEVRVIDDLPVDRVPAAGSAWTTAHDAGKWLAFLLAGGQAGGKRLVSEANFRELLAPQMIAPPMYPTAGIVGSRWLTYGLGWFQQDYRGQFVAMHTGSIAGRTAIVGLVPERKLGVFVFGNLDHAEFRHALLWKVIDLWTGAPSRDWNAECLRLYGDLKAQAKKADADREAKRVMGTSPSHPLEAYAGTYSHAAWGAVVIGLEQGRLVVRIGPSPLNAGVLEHWNYDTFRTKPGDGREGWVPIGFTLGLDGSVAGLMLGSPGMIFSRDRAPAK